MQFMDNSLEGKGKLCIGRKDRDREKRIILYRWLFEFQGTDIFVVIRLLGISRQAAQKFLTVLEQNKYIQVTEKTFPSATRKIYSITGKGFRDWTSLEEVTEVFASRSKFAHSSNLPHHLCVQHAVLDLVMGGDKQNLSRTSAYWEHDLPQEWARRPDALVKQPLVNASGDTVVAHLVFEFEKTAKNSKLIYKIYQQHIEAIQKRRYHAVVMVFPDEGIRSRYLKLFREPQWPLMETDTDDSTARPVMINDMMVYKNRAEIANLDKMFHFRVCTQDAIKSLL